MPNDDRFITNPNQRPFEERITFSQQPRGQNYNNYYRQLEALRVRLTSAQSDGERNALQAELRTFLGNDWMRQSNLTNDEVAALRSRFSPYVNSGQDPRFVAMRQGVQTNQAAEDERLRRQFQQLPLGRRQEPASDYERR